MFVFDLAHPFQPPTMYTISFLLTVIGYLTLIIFPRQSWANYWFAGIIVPTILGMVYSLVLFYYFLDPPRSKPLDFLSLAGLRTLFEKDGLLLAGFLDLLIMPLMVAAWMTRKAAQIRMPYVYLLPCVVLTMGVPGTGVVLFVLLSSLGGRLAQGARFEGQPPVNTTPVFARPGGDD